MSFPQLRAPYFSFARVEVAGGDITGTGALTAQAATISGVGLSVSSGSGTPAAQAATVSASGISASTGTGVLADQSSIVAGTGVALWEASGSLTGQAAVAAGAGTSASTGTGALSASASALTGIGEVVSGITGTGALSAQDAQLSGAGDVSGQGNQLTPIGGGAPWYSESWRRKKYQAWELPPPQFPMEYEPPAQDTFPDTAKPEPISADARAVTAWKARVRPHSRRPAPPRSIPPPSTPRPWRPSRLRETVQVETQTDHETVEALIRAWQREEEEELLTLMEQHGLLS